MTTLHRNSRVSYAPNVSVFRHTIFCFYLVCATKNANGARGRKPKPVYPSAQLLRCQSILYQHFSTHEWEVWSLCSAKGVTSPCAYSFGKRAYVYLTTQWAYVYFTTQWAYAHVNIQRVFRQWRSCFNGSNKKPSAVLALYESKLDLRNAERGA